MSEEGIKILEACYGRKNIIEVSPEEAFNFAANGRLVRKQDGSQILFYKEGALSEATLQNIARVESGELQSSRKDGYTVHNIVQGNTTVLRLIPMPTTETWKGGGSISCITQFVPTRYGLTALVMPPTDYKPNPANALNEIERELITFLSHKKAWAEYDEVISRLKDQGIRVVEMKPKGHTEAIYPRDPADTFVEKANGAGFDPLQNPLDENDVITIYLARCGSLIRQPETPNLVKEIIQVIP